jgi:hypothetical protein
MFLRDIADLISTITKRSGATTANRVRLAYRSFSPIQRGRADPNPIANAQKNKEVSRDRVLTPSELRLIWNNLGDDLQRHHQAIGSEAPRFVFSDPTLLHALVQVIIPHLLGRATMARTFLTAVVISFMAGVLPASAQGGGGCDQYCRNGPCAGGGVNRMPGSPICMRQCMEACQKKSKTK